MTVIPILLYHSISDDPASWIAPYSVSPDMFARHMDLIAESGRTAVSISGLISGLTGQTMLPDHPLAITFDDGFADFIAAAEVMAAHRLPSTLYVTTGALGGHKPRPPKMALPPAAMLDWGQLGYLAELDVEIGAHSHTHRQLDILRAADVTEEVRYSKDLLEQACGRAIPSFAYPHGFNSPRTRRMVAAAGHTSACAVMNALSSDSDRIFALARLTVKATTSAEQITEWLSGTGAPVAPYRERLRTRLWRWTRRVSGPLSGLGVFDEQPIGADRGRRSHGS